MNNISLLFGGLLTQVWINVAFIVCAFIAVLYRPDRIHHFSLFRIGIFLFALSLILPNVGILLLHFVDDTG